jgi:hypothetical protein
MADLGNRTNVNAAIDTLLDDLAPNNSIQPSDHNGLLKDILDTLANGLSVALRTGNTTSGQNLEITSGDSIQFDNSTFLGSLVSGTLTGAQTYTLPDKSGTVAMTSDISNILTANGIVMTGTYSHDLAGNTLTMDGGVINVTNGGFGVLGSGNVTSDGINNVLFSFIGSSGHQTLIVRDDNDSVAIGTSAADLSSVFEIASTTKGVLFPRMTTAKRDLIALPVESLLIYNTTTHQFEFRSSGASWDALGGGASLYSQDDTIGAGRIATLTDTLLFKGGSVKIEGADTLSTSTAFEIYDGDTTPFKLWDWRNNGDVYLSKDCKLYTSGNNPFTFSSSKTTSGGAFVFDRDGGNGNTVDVLKTTGNGVALQLTVNTTTSGGLNISSPVAADNLINLSNSLGSFFRHDVQSSQNVVTVGSVDGARAFNVIGNGDNFSGTKYINTQIYNSTSLVEGVAFGWDTSTRNGIIRVDGGCEVNFTGAINSNGMGVNVEPTTTEALKVGGDTKTTGNMDAATYSVNGTAGFTGTGAYTTLTIENGIITNAV